MTFSPNINLIYGENGKGKTSILEAIHFLSISKSFRKGKRNDVRTRGKLSMSISGKIESAKNKHTHIAYRSLNNNKKILINHKKVNRISELIGQFQSVILSPEDVDIVSGGNAAKHTFINKILSLTSPHYLDSLSRYKRALQQRNRAISEMQQKKNISLWDEPLADLSTKMWKERKVFFEKFNTLFYRLWEKINSERSCAINYKTKAFDTPREMVTAMGAQINSDLLRKKTGLGPHKDIIEFKFNGLDVKDQASQGEKKLFLILLKISEAEYMQQRLGVRPVLLMDDLFAKLDKKRGEKVLKLFENKYQTFITTTDNSAEAYFNSPVNLIQLSQDDEKCFVA
jgi:DNA replication and repair protein RecF